MEHRDKVVNSQKKQIFEQLNHTTAYGIDGLGIAPRPKESIGNEDIEADKKQKS